MTYNYSVWKKFTRQSFPQLLNESKLFISNSKHQLADHTSVDKHLNDFKNKQVFVEYLKHHKLNYNELNRLVKEMISHGVPGNYKTQNLVVFSLFCFYYDSLLSKVVDIYYNNPRGKTDKCIEIHLNSLNPPLTIRSFIELQLKVLELLAIIHEDNPVNSVYILRHLRRNCLFIISKHINLLNQNELVYIIKVINRLGFYSVKWSYIYLGFLKPMFYEMTQPQIEDVLYNLQQYDLNYLKRLDMEKPAKYEKTTQSSLIKFKNMVSMLVVLYIEKGSNPNARTLSQILKNLSLLKITLLPVNIQKLSKLVHKVLGDFEINLAGTINLLFYFSMLENLSDKTKAYDSALIPFYDYAADIFESRINDINSWKSIGKLLLAFSKVNYFPESLLKRLKSQFFYIYQNQNNDDRLENMKEKIDNLKLQLDNLKMQEKSSETTAEYFKIQQSLRSAYLNLNRRTNSFLELKDIIEALGKFSQAINDSNFVEDLYKVVAVVYDELLKDNKQIELILQHSDQLSFFLFCRSCCLLFKPQQASRIVSKTFKMIAANYEKMGELNYKKVNILFQ